MSRAFRLACLAPLCGLALPFALAQDEGGQFEPNQTRRTAKRLEPGDYKGLFCNSEDWYAIDVPKGKRLELSIQFTHAEGDLDLEVQDSRGRRLGWSAQSGDEEVLSVAPTDAETVYVRVYNAENRYALHAELVEISANRQNVNCWGSDWYVVDLEAGRELKATAAFSHAKGDLDMELFNETGETQLATSGGQGDEETLKYKAEEDQRLLLHVYHVHRARNVYTLSVTQDTPVKEDLAEVFGVARPEQGKLDAIELRRGDVLQGTILNEGFRLATAHADISFPAVRLAGLQLEQSGMSQVVTVEQDSFKGFLRDEVLRIKVEGLGQPIELRRELVGKILFARRGKERVGQSAPHQVALRSGDRFRGKLLVEEQELELDLGYARLPLKVEDVDSLMFEANGTATVLRRDQTSASGKLSATVFKIALETGAGAPVQLELHPAALTYIYLKEDDGRPGVLQGAQLRLIVKRLAPNAPEELLRKLANGPAEERAGVVDQLRRYFTKKTKGSPMLQRHLLGTEDLGERYAWLQVLLRIDESVQDKVAKTLGQANYSEGVRAAATDAICRLAIEGQGYGALQKAISYGTAVSGALMMRVGYGTKNSTVRNWMMNQGGLRQYYTGNRKSVTPSEREELSKALPEILR